MDVQSDFKAFQDRVTSSLVNAARTAGQISAEDLGFHRSSHGVLSRSLDAQNSRLLQLTNRLLKAATTGSHIAPPKLNTSENVEDNWKGVVDVVDDMLERADACLDEFTGVIKRLSPSLQDGAVTPSKAKEKSKKAPSIFSPSVMPKPQLLFQRAPNNQETAPFKPLLQSKPHAIIPLEESSGLDAKNEYEHPYKIEIERSTYPLFVYVSSPPIPFTPPAESQLVFVDTEEGVEAMLAELKEAKEIAIDLEHHDTRSYVGLVSLMQISTRERDWIVDTLQPWRENLQILNEVFADPTILKVFHGSSMDMIWLQRDLGLYVVGLFDTYHASVALSLPTKSLKYLLSRFADFNAQKKYQTADWRIRPIPDEMMDYARSDTHYLLFIYDHLRNMLLETSSPDNNLVDYVQAQSKKEALQRYERPIYDDENGLGANGWYNQLIRRTQKMTNEQFGVYRAVHAWRDGLARRLDEGVPFIMTAAALFAIAESMPTSVPALMGALRPISRAVTEHARDLVEVIKDGKDTGREGPSVQEVIKRNEELVGPRPGYRSWQVKRRENDQASDQGIGATLQMLVENGETGPVVRRSSSSQLWGSVLGRPSVAGNLALLDASADALRSVLPLPSRSEISFDAAIQGLHTPTVQVSALSVAQPVKGDQASSKTQVGGPIFIVKEIGRPEKRKSGVPSGIDIPTASPTSNSPETNADFASMGANGTQQRASQAEFKAHFEEEKRSKNKQIAAAAAAAAPFDYANADSMLHAKPSRGHNEDGKGKKRPFDPYAKALDAPLGMKRARKEVSGKSFTFKK